MESIPNLVGCLGREIELRRINLFMSKHRFGNWRRGFNRVRSWAQPCLIATIISLLGFILTAEDSRPNVLFIAIDDLRPELGCYGVEGIHSPNIDALADSGVLFNRAYCQLAVCNPSRVSLLTGLRPDSAKVWTLDVRFRDTVPDALTLPQHFKANGYETLGYGKIFHNPWPDDISWSEPHSWPKDSSLWSSRARKDLLVVKARMKEEGKSQRAIDRLRAVATEIVDIPDSEHVDGAITDQAIEAMQKAASKDEPFFLAAGFIRPHLPFVVPRKYWELYDREKIALSEGDTLPAGSPSYAMNTMYELRDYVDFLGTPEPGEGHLEEAQSRRLKHGYYASVSFIDAQVGRLIDELTRLGLAENTIVVLWGDHGWKLGEHNSWCKQTNYEIDARVPLIIRDPGARANGEVSESLVELVDVFPTLCDLSGISIPEQLEGISLKPVLEDSSAKPKAVAISQFLRRLKDQELMGYSMRTERWRFIEWIDRETKKTVSMELYDHASDSGEIENVAGRNENGGLLIQLAKQLRDALPLPLALQANEGVAGKRKAERPKVSFVNEGKEPVTLFWLPDGGERKEVGVLSPGERRTQTTSKGHRFLVQGKRVKQIFAVTKMSETHKVGILPPVRGGDQGKMIADPPNIVVIMGDDWSWPHASVLGDPTVKTPAFDRIAREGVLFENAFVSAPSCTPSRHAVSSGQYHWRLGEGVDLGGSIASDVPVYPDMLSAVGYKTGFCRKGTGPSQHTYRGNDPFGKRFKNFDEFMDGRENSDPFCFWYGAGEPHRPYDWGASKDSELDLESIVVPPFLPDNAMTRTDLGDYYLRVQQLDQFAEAILKRLEDAGELENSIVVMTGDNGMPFPRAKATLYDSGTRVPLAIRWGNRVEKGRHVQDFVNLTDLAPTFLEAVGLPVPKDMTGSSLLPILQVSKSGQIEASRDHVLTGMEQHVYPNPSRSIRTADHLYIRNFAPESWPTGRVAGEPANYDFLKTPWPTEAGAFSHNVDPGPTKQWMLQNEPAENEEAFGLRPAEELYDLTADPHQLNNLIAGAEIPKATVETRNELSRRLTEGLRASRDPRFVKPNHASFEVRGWTVHLHDQLWRDEPVATRRALELLDGQLHRVVEVVPKKALGHLRDVPLWINPEYEGIAGSAEYHAEAGWLRKNGRNPEMGKAVEITNVKKFPFENRRMPFLLLHELAHAYHNQVVADGYRDADLKAAYERARDSGSYDSVARFNGNKTVKDKAYGMSNPMEYFAESTEAYFGKNDFFPFNRAELKKHDPLVHDLVARLWGAKE